MTKYAEAVTAYDQALAIDPLYNVALADKGLALTKMGKFDEAVKLFDAVLERDPNDIYALNNK